MSRGHKKIENDLTGRFIHVGRDRSTVTLDDRPRWRILVPLRITTGWCSQMGIAKSSMTASSRSAVDRPRIPGPMANGERGVAFTRSR